MEKTRWLRWAPPVVRLGCERQRDHACKLCYIRHSQPQVPPLPDCPSENNKVKAKVGLCRQGQPTRNYSLEDMITVVQSARPASSQLQVSWAGSHSRSMVKSGREGRSWLPGSASSPQSHCLSSAAWLSSATCCLCPWHKGRKTYCKDGSR